MSFSIPNLDIQYLEYSSRDPISTDYHLFKLGQISINFNQFYIYNSNSNKIMLITDWELINSTYIKIKLDTDIDKFHSSVGTRHIILTTQSSLNVDFIDKTGQTGVQYVYGKFSINNDSRYKYMNTHVVSTDLSVALKSNKYPYTTENISYVNGSPSSNISPQISGYYDPNNFWLFHRNKYVSSCSLNGYVSGYNASKGIAELVYKGIIEFSLSSLGPWSTSLSIGNIDRNSYKQIFYRCGKDISTQYKALNSLKVFITEVV